jgi:predicted NBD/HSP70 family sugar kinase
VLDGKPWVGRSAGGEIGHIVVKMGGRRCPCGRRGCMEAYAGRGAMEARARRLQKKGEHTDLFKIMEQRRPQPADQRRHRPRAAAGRPDGAGDDGHGGSRRSAPASDRCATCSIPRP